MNPIEEFESFANSKMNNHFLTLQANYSQACKDHAAAFRQELQEKINELVEKNNADLAIELFTRRNKFEQKFMNHTEKTETSTVMPSTFEEENKEHFAKRELNEDEEY